MQIDGDISGTVRFWPGAIHVTERGTVRLSNPTNGKTLTNWWRINFRGQGTETFNDDGTLTVSFDDSFAGIPERWIDDDGTTLIMDRGLARFVGEFHIDLGDPDDPFDDEFLGFEEEITINGPHPVLENGPDHVRSRTKRDPTSPGLDLVPRCRRSPTVTMDP